VVLHPGAAALDGDGGGCVRRSSSAEVLAEVYGVATLRSQPLCYTNVDTHVDEKTLAVYDAMTSSSASHAAYSSACCTSAASTSG
jgi:hypothetical protein